MTYQEIQNRIVDTFWSEGLKNHIRKTSYVFPAEDLLTVIYQHIHDFEERQKYYTLLMDHVPEVSAHAAQVAAWELQCLADFRNPNPGEVYELRVTDEPGGEEARLLCVDFDTALALIDRYYEHYDWLTETERSRYSIYRRKLLTAKEHKCDDELGSCDLLPGKRIERVWYGPKSELPDCMDECYRCHQNCVQNQEAEYPNFLPDRSPVRYRLPNGAVHFGLTLNQMTVESLIYIIPLHESMIANRDYSQFCICHEHEHIPFPDVDAASREELPDDMRDNLDAFLAFLKEEYPQ